MATVFAEDDYDDYTGRIGPDGEPERYSTMLGGDPRLLQQRELASRAQRLAEPILIDNWLKSITKDARGTEAASQVTLTPGVQYQIRDFTGNNDGQIIASGNTPEELLRLQDAAQALARQGTRADYRLEQVGGPDVAAFAKYTDPATGQTVQVIGGDLYNKPIASSIAEIAIPVALAVLGGIYLAPVIAPGAAAGSAAAAGGLAAGTGIGSTAGNLLVGKPLDQALISGLTTAATAGGGSFLGPQIGPIVGSAAVGTGIGAGIGNFAANVVTGKSLEDAAKMAGIAGLSAGTIDALFGGGASKSGDGSTGIFGTKVVNGQIVDSITGDVLSAAEIASARALQAASGASSGGTGSTGGGGATVATGGGPLITVTGSGIGTLGSTFGAGAANLGLPNFGSVDTSNVRVPSNDEVAGTYRDLDGNLRDNTTGAIIVSNTTGGIGTLGSSFGAGAANVNLPPPAPPPPPPGTPTADDKQIDVEGDRNKPPPAPPPPAPPPPPPGTPKTDDKQIDVEADRDKPPGAPPPPAPPPPPPGTPPADEIVVTNQKKYPFTILSDDITRLISEPLFPPNGTQTDPPKTTKQKVLATLKTIAGLTPLVGALASVVGGGGGGGGTIDAGPGLTVGGIGGGRIRNPATFDPFTYGQREGEFDFFRNAPATTGTVTGIGGTGTTGTTTTGTTGTTTTGTTTAGTPGPAATAAEVSAAFPGYTNIRQAADGRWFGEPIPGYTASGPAPTGLRVTAGSTFNPTVEDYRLFNPGFESIERDAAGQFIGTRFEDVPGTPTTTTVPRTYTEAEIRSQFPNYTSYTQSPTGQWTGSRTTSTPRTYTEAEIRTQFPGYESYGQEADGQWYGVKSESAPAPNTQTGGPALAEGGEVDDDMVRHLIEYRKGGGHMGPGQVKGIGSGQEDKIPAWLSDGEYVWSAQDVADLGDGSTDEGVRRLDRMRKMVRQQAGRKDVKKIAKPQRGIEDMLKAVGGAV